MKYFVRRANSCSRIYMKVLHNGKQLFRFGFGNVTECCIHPLDGIYWKFYFISQLAHEANDNIDNIHINKNAIEAIHGRARPEKGYKSAKPTKGIETNENGPFFIQTCSQP